MRYRVRTLLILLVVGPILLAAGWWRYSAWRAEQVRQKAINGALFDPGGPPSIAVDGESRLWIKPTK